MKQTLRPKRDIAVLLTTFMLAACSELNEANFSRLQVGMSFEEVRGILGRPAGCDEALGLPSCRWGDDDRRVKVAFVGGRVAVTAANNLR